MAGPTACEMLLEYGAQPPRARVWIRRTILLFVLLGFGGAGWRWVPGLWRSAELSYWRRRCITDCAPSGTVAYEEQPAAATRLLAAGGYVDLRLPGQRAYGIAARSTRPWDRLNTIAGMDPVPPGAMLFLHERTSPAGQRRIVMVLFEVCQPFSSTGPKPDALGLRPYTLDPDLVRVNGGYSSGAWDSRGSLPSFEDSAPAPHVLRFYVGEPNPGDDSRFTIAYEVDGRAGKIKGQLVDDNEVHMEHEDPQSWNPMISERPWPPPGLATTRPAAMTHKVPR